MKFNERKKRTLEYFSRREWVRPRRWAVDAKFIPTRSAHTYLLHLYNLRLLRRGRDVKGCLVYRLSNRGAKWLLRRKT